MRSCGEQFALFVHAGTSRIVQGPGNRCGGDRLCPMCTKREAVERISLTAATADAALRGGSGRTAYLATLTLPNDHDLRAGVRRLGTALRAVTRQIRRGRRSACPTTRIVGGAWWIECPPSTTGGGWNLHAHGVLVAERNADIGAIASQWEATHGGHRSAEFTAIDDAGDAVLTLLRVIGYALKPPHPSINELIRERHDALRGVRMFRTFGDFQGNQTMWPADGWVRLDVRLNENEYDVESTPCSAPAPH